MDLETKTKKKVISATILLSGGDLLTGEEAKNYIAEVCSSQLKEVLGVIESKKADEMSASEGIKTVALSDNLCHRLYNSNKKEWVAAEIYNQALEDLKAEVEKLV